MGVEWRRKKNRDKVFRIRTNENDTSRWKSICGLLIVCEQSNCQRDWIWWSTKVGREKTPFRW